MFQVHWHCNCTSASFRNFGLLIVVNSFYYYVLDESVFVKKSLSYHFSLKKKNKKINNWVRVGYEICVLLLILTLCHCNIQVQPNKAHNENRKNFKDPAKMNWMPNLSIKQTYRIFLNCCSWPSSVGYTPKMKIWVAPQVRARFIQDWRFFYPCRDHIFLACIRHGFLLFFPPWCWIKINYFRVGFKNNQFKLHVIFLYRLNTSRKNVDSECDDKTGCVGLFIPQPFTLIKPPPPPSPPLLLQPRSIFRQKWSI